MSIPLLAVEDRDLMNQLDALSIITDVLPCQWADHHRPTLRDPMSRLLFALLESACWDIQSSNRHLRREALDWLGNDVKSPLSFTHVCDAFGWDADWLRAGIVRWAFDVARGRAARVQRRRPIIDNQRADGKRYGSNRIISRFA